MLSQLPMVWALTSIMNPNSYSLMPNLRRILRISFPVFGDGGGVVFLGASFFLRATFLAAFLAGVLGIGRFRGAGESGVLVSRGASEETSTPNILERSVVAMRRRLLGLEASKVPLRLVSMSSF